MTALVTFSSAEARAATAIFERMFPADPDAPGATAIGVVDYLDRALAGPYGEHVETYRLGLRALDGAAGARHHRWFADCEPDEQDRLLGDLERGQMPGLGATSAAAFFELIRAHLLEGLFSDPIYGGNREKLGWKVLGHPGVWLENSEEEALSAEPALKGGEIHSLADLDLDAAPEPSTIEITGYDPPRGTLPPGDAADVVLVGVAGMG